MPLLASVRERPHIIPDLGRSSRSDSTGVPKGVFFGTGASRKSRHFSGDAVFRPVRVFTIWLTLGNQPF